jgi:PAS domain S-box-containing protein
MADHVNDELEEQPKTQEIRRRLELILDAAGEGIYGLDSDGRTTFVNPAAAEMLQFRAEDLLGRSMHTVLHHSHPDGSPYDSQDCPIYQAFKDGREHTVDDEVFWRKDGTSFPVEYTSTPIRHRGELLGAVVVFRNLSEIRKTQEDLRRSLEELGALKDRLEAENVYLQEEIRQGHNASEILGSSAPIERVLKAIEIVAPTDANVLITGETGSGKELVARAVHCAGARRDKPLIKVNCASIPRELFESEFFGHVRGSFTGAVKDRAGRFELADGGTLFLDEVGEIPLEMQSKLLRVLQEGTYERIGDERTRRVDVRVLAASNRALLDEVDEGRFRQDLYYRLSVFPIVVPPLRERKDDIGLLAGHFLERIATEMGADRPRLTRANVEDLQAYDWPGNVRELRNVLERALITARGGPIRFELPDARPADLPAGRVPPSAPDTGTPYVSDAEMKRRDRDNTLAALEEADWKVYGEGGAAELLGMRPTTLASRIKKLGLRRP